MDNYSDFLRRFVQTSRGRGQLDPAPSREAIGIAISEGLPTSNQTTPTGGGVAWPLDEQSRVTQTVRICCDTDPTLFIDFEVATQVTFQDQDGTERVMNLTPDLTSNCP